MNLNRSRVISFFLLAVFLFWIWPDLVTHHVNEASTLQTFLIDRKILGLNAGQIRYGREEVEGVAVEYHRAYFDFEMRGIYRILLRLRSGKKVILHQLQTTKQLEPSLLLGSDLKIKEMQSCTEARALAARLSLPLEGCA